jgi:hypothetical protein
MPYAPTVPLPRSSHPCLSSPPPFTSTARLVGAGAGWSVLQLGEASRTILHGMCARAPLAADVSAGNPPRAPPRSRRSRSASGHAVAAGSGVGRM